MTRDDENAIAIVGGGIGGLALAGTLARLSLPFVLLEQAPALTEVGAGIQIAPNGVHVLRFLGVEEKMAETAGKPTVYHARDWKTGHTLYKAPRNPAFEEKYGAPYYQVHRADLLDALRSAVPASHIRLGRRVTDIRPQAGRVELEMADGETMKVRAAVGADGVHSVVRNRLFGAESPRFAGIVVYRFTAPADQLPAHFADIGSSTFHGPNGHATIYPISAGRLINCALSFETDEWETESWSLEADKDEVRKAFEGWHPDIHTLIDAAASINKWALFDREPFDRWTDGNVTLLGDAAHPMLPFLAQGACMAIEDAYVLGALLSRAAGDAEAAFAAYEAARRPRTSRVQQAARARVVSMHEPSPIGRLLRNLNYWIAGLLGRSGKRFNPDWIYRQNVVEASPPAGETG